MFENVGLLVIREAPRLSRPSSEAQPRSLQNLLLCTSQSAQSQLQHGCQPGAAKDSRESILGEVLTIRRRDPWPDGFPRGSIWIWGGLRYTNLRTFPDTLIFKSTASRFTECQKSVSCTANCSAAWAVRGSGAWLRVDAIVGGEYARQCLWGSHVVDTERCGGDAPCWMLLQRWHAA